jgi:hypothetical protein
MKLRSIKEVTADNPLITIQINPDNQKTSMVLSYTCPDCAGYGCGRHGSPRANPDCSGGTVEMKLDPAKIDQIFDSGQAMRIKAALENLYLDAIGD